MEIEFEWDPEKEKKTIESIGYHFTRVLPYLVIRFLGPFLILTTR